jgi:hypothetical protein
MAQAVPGRMGSPTYDRLATASIIGGLIHPTLHELSLFHGLKKMLRFVTGGADEAIRDSLFSAISDSAMARALMLKATPGNVKLAEPVFRKLAQGTVVGSSVSHQSDGRTSP